MKRFLKWTGITLLVLIAIITAAYFYIINNADKILHDFVDRETNGKFALEIGKIDFSLSELRLTFIDPHFFSKDTVTEAKTYNIRIDSLILDVYKLRPLIFQKKILMDTISAMRPQVTVTKWKDIPKEKFSLPEQMAKAYQSLDKLVSNLNVKYCLIDSGHFTLVDKVKPGSVPVSVTDYYLRIDNLNRNSNEVKESRYLFTDQIKFYSSHQDIALPDGKHWVKYGRLRINSMLKSVEIDSCFLYEKKDSASFGELGIYMDTLRFTHVDFPRLTESGLIAADSVLCINPVINVKIESKAKDARENSLGKRLASDSAAQVIRNMFGDLSLNYVGVNDAAIEVQAMSNNKVSAFSSQDANIFLWNINISRDVKVQPSVGSIFLQLKNYNAYNADSTYRLTFDGILLTDTKINLTNFAVLPTDKNTNRSDRKEIKMGFLEIDQLSWRDLVFNRRIVAKAINMVEPDIYIAVPAKRPDKKEVHKSVFAVLHSFTSQVGIEQLNIIKANVNYHGANGNHLKLDKVNATIRVNDFLRANNVNDFASAAQEISFAGGTFSAGDNLVLIDKGIYTQQQKLLKLSKLDFDLKKSNTVAQLEDVWIEDFSNESNSFIDIGKLNWARGKITVNVPAKSGKEPLQKQDNKKEFHLLIGQLQGQQTQLSIQSDKFSAGLEINNLKTNKIDYDNKSIPVIEGLQLSGNDLRYSKDAALLEVKKIELNDHAVSTLQEVKFYTDRSAGRPTISAPDISFIPIISSLLNKQTEVKDIILNKPEFYFETKAAKQKTTAGKALPVLDINKVSIINPVFVKLPGGIEQKMDFSHLQSGIQISGIHSTPEKATVDEVELSFSNISSQLGRIALPANGKEKLTAVFDQISYTPALANAETMWSANLRLLSARNFDLVSTTRDSLQNKIFIRSIDAEHIILHGGKKITMQSLLAENQNMAIRNGSINVITPTSNFDFEGLKYDNEIKQLSMESFSFSPLIDHDSFYRKYPWPKDYMQFKAGRTAFSGINSDLYFNDTILSVRKIEFTDPVLSIYKDKTLPPDDPKYKPLVNGMIAKIQQAINIDSIQVHNGEITYEEISNKTGLHGIVHFTKLNATASGFKTTNTLADDSLKLYATATLSDNIDLRLRFNQSYLDTLNGFRLALRLSPFDMPGINSILQPLVSAKIKRGTLDTLYMHAIGREHLAYGKMKMYYSKLKVSYLNKGDEANSNFKTRIISFAANNLILKRNNKKGYGVVYTERLTEKGFLGYWIRMLLSGVISSTGVKSNKKQERRYHRSIKKMNLPEIEELSF